MVRASTKDGKLLVGFALAVLTGKQKKATVRDRIAAMEFLADRGFGKAVETHTLQNPDGSAIRQTLIIALGQAIARGDVTIADVESKRLLEPPSASVGLPKSVGNGNGHS